MASEHPQSNNDTKRLGKGMIIAAWVMALGLLTLFFNDILNHQYNPNQKLQSMAGKGEVMEVVLKRNRLGHYVASGLINNEPVVFLLDTGATDVALNEQLANKLQLRRGNRFIAHTANGKVHAWRTTLDSVKLGGVELSNVRASILPSMHGNEVLLGMSFLKQLELIQRGSTLTIRQIK